MPPHAICSSSTCAFGRELQDMRTGTRTDTLERCPSEVVFRLPLTLGREGTGARKADCREAKQRRRRTLATCLPLSNPGTLFRKRTIRSRPKVLCRPDTKFALTRRAPLYCCLMGPVTGFLERRSVLCGRLRITSGCSIV